MGAKEVTVLESNLLLVVHTAAGHTAGHIPKPIVICIAEAELVPSALMLSFATNLWGGLGRVCSGGWNGFGRVWFGPAAEARTAPTTIQPSFFARALPQYIQVIAAADGSVCMKRTLQQ